MTLKLIESYLKNQYEYMNLNELAPDELEVRLRKPQGIILGPFLSLINVNDIANMQDIPELVM